MTARNGAPTSRRRGGASTSSAATGRATSAGIEFGPTANGKYYVSMNAHRGSRPAKTKWLKAVTPYDEYQLFAVADDHDDQCSKGHYWSFGDSDGSKILGGGDERLGKHPRTSNEADPWHGYPVSPRATGDKDAPSDDLVTQWLQESRITRTFARRIRDRRI